MPNAQLTLTGHGDPATDRTPFELDGYDWTFEHAETNPDVHGLNNYPAQFPPQVPSQLLTHFTRTGILDDTATIYDPFCGSGTTLVEARRHGIDAIGTDINPFACWLSRTKATPIDTDRVRAALNNLLSEWRVHDQFIEEAFEAGDLEDEPTAVNADWFPEPQVYKLGSLHRRFRELRGTYDYRTVRFLRVALAETARQVSYQKPGEFKRMRIDEDERDDHDLAVLPVFLELVEENLARMETFAEDVSPEPETTVRLLDARDPEAIPKNSVDALITSPPYGDHRTTVAYGQFSREQMVAATPFDQAAMREVDKQGLGGRSSVSNIDFETVRDWSPALNETVRVLAEKDGRSEDALSFFADYAECLRRFCAVVRPGQPAVFVVGNRTMSRVPIPTRLITEELGEAVGFTCEHTEPRTIPTKTLPWENAPENVAGETGAMMADEHIVVFTAPETPSRAE